VIEADHVILAVPWRAAIRLVSGSIAAPLSEPWRQIEAAPITGVHLWLDRPLTELPHAVLVGRLSQWVFARAVSNPQTDYYYQVVISASRQLSGRSNEEIIAEVWQDLQATFPHAGEARLVRWRVVTQQEAVFSVTPEFESLRPAQATAIAGLSLAGDWTSTGWPATMEGAVRSGYLAAESALASLGRPQNLLAPDLPRAWLMRLM
jgi:uncharacterized protein with NAD-binding domain and iron-sulfur cluster